MTAGPWEQYSGGGQTTEAAGPWTKFGGGQASKAQAPEADETFLGLSKGGLKASGEALGKVGLSTANELAVFGDMFINSVNSLVPMAAAGATQYIKGLFTGADASKTSKLARQAVTMAAEQYSPDVLKKLVGAISEYVPQEVRPGASQQESFIQKAMDLTDIDAKNLELATNGVVKKEDVQNIRDILLTTLGAKGGVEGAKRLTEAKPPEPGKPAAAEAPKGGAEEDVLSKWKAKATEADAERRAADPLADAPTLKKAGFVDQYGKPLTLAATGAGLAALWPGDDKDKSLAAMVGIGVGLGELRGLPESTPLRAILDRGSNTLKTLERLPGNRFDFSTKEIREALQREGVPKAEKDVIAPLLEGRERISAKDLVSGIKEATGDFELKPRETGEYAEYGLDSIGRGGLDRFGRETTSPEIEPTTTIYQSPVELGTANHFSDPNYFAHTRSFEEGGMRHVVEMQSDVAQKAGKELSGEERARLAEEKSTYERALFAVENAYDVIHDVSSTVNDYAKALRNLVDSYAPEVQLDVKLRLGKSIDQRYNPRTRDIEFLDFLNQASEKGDFDKIFDKAVSIYDEAAKSRRIDMSDISALSSAVDDALYNELQRLKTRRSELNAKLSEQAGLDPIRPMLKDWHKRLVREELARAGREREGLGADFEKFLHAVAEEKALKDWFKKEDARDATGAAPRTFLRMAKESDLEKATALRKRLSPLDPAAAEQSEARMKAPPVVRFATADTVAKVEGWPLLADQWRRNALYYRVGSAEYEAAMEKARDPEKQRFAPEHQGIYDRYRGDVEPFLKKLGGKPYTDAHGHTWIEVPTEGARGKGGEQTHAIGRAQMFGRAPVDQITMVLGLSAAGAAALAAYRSSEENPIQNAILAGSAVLAARGLPRYFRYVREDWRGALKTTAAAGIAAATVGGIQKDPVAAALAGLAVGGFKMLPRHVPLEVKPGLTMDQLVNLRAAGLATREREYLTMKAAIKTAAPDQARREAITRAIDSGDLRGLSARERDVAAAWKGFSDAIGKEALDEGLMKDFVQNYVTHVVERKGLPKSMVQEAMDTIFATRSQGAGLPMTSKFMRTRKFETIADLEEALEKTNLQLRTLDLAEIAEIYGRSMGRAIENKRFVDVLKEAREGGQLGKGSPFILGEEKAPASYVRVNVPALRGNLVHPDIAGPLKFVMEARTENELINGALALSMAQKRLAVGGSFFHAMNLGLAHLGAHGLRGAADLGREVLGGAGFPVDRPIRAAIENYRRGGAGDTIDELLRAGLQTKPLADVNVNALSQLGGLADQISARLLGDRVKPFTKAADVLETVQKRYFDHFTWDYMHSGLKLLTAMREFEKALRENPGMPREEVARRVASYTNDTYGGLDWQRVAQEATSGLGRRMANIALSPNGRILTQIALFAPDWSLSTFRAMFRALPGAESSLKSRWAGIPMTLQQRYALRTGLFYLTLVDGINYQTSGHHLWENKDPLRIEFRDGTAMQAFKHAAEFGEWLQDPIKVARNKLGAIPKELVSQVDSVQFPGSKTPLTGAGPRLAHAAEEFLPFGLKPMADQSLSPGEAAVRGALGTVGVQFYGRTAEQKQRLKDDPGKQEAREKKKLARILEPKL